MVFCGEGYAGRGKGGAGVFVRGSGAGVCEIREGVSVELGVGGACVFGW